MYKTTFFISSSSASLFSTLALKLMIATLPLTYPFLLFILSILGEFGFLRFLPFNPSSIGIPRTGHFSGISKSDFSISKGIPFFFARYLAFAYSHPRRPSLVSPLFLFAFRSFSRKSLFFLRCLCLLACSSKTPGFSRLRLWDSLHFSRAFLSIKSNRSFDVTIFYSKIVVNIISCSQPCGLARICSRWFGGWAGTTRLWRA